MTVTTAPEVKDEPKQVAPVPAAREDELPPDVAERFREIENFPFQTDDGEPLETAWHRDCMNLLIASVLWWFRDREDFYAGGNMFIYFSPRHVFHRDFRGPDVFVVNGGVPLHPPRPNWIVWFENGRYPDVIFELSSPTTAVVDRTTKYELYQTTWRTRNYFIYDPETRRLDGWELDADHHYQPLTPNEQGRLWCAELGLWVGTWDGEYFRHTMTWVRFFDRDGNLVQTREEFVAQRAAEEKRRADEATRRADELAAELERLRAQLKQPKTANGDAAPPA
jgi:Uma2 family endonuclease